MKNRILKKANQKRLFLWIIAAIILLVIVLNLQEILDGLRDGAKAAGAGF